MNKKLAYNPYNFKEGIDKYTIQLLDLLKDYNINGELGISRT